MRITPAYLLGLVLLCPGLAFSADPVRLAHDEFLPADVYGSRQDRPDQVLFEIASYRLTLGNETIPQAIPGAQGSIAWLFLEGRSMVSGNSVSKAQVNFVEAEGRMLPGRLDQSSQTLMLYLPSARLDTLLGVLSKPGPHYVQARFYANGTVWSDIHSGPVPVGR